MQDMHSVRGPATVIFTALLIIIMVSASRTTYTLALAKRPEGVAVASCAPPEPVREAAERRACSWPHATRRANRWPTDAAADAAAPNATPPPPADDAWTAQAPPDEALRVRPAFD